LTDAFGTAKIAPPILETGPSWPYHILAVAVGISIPKWKYEQREEMLPWVEPEANASII
jgi:hypothetical protein